MKAEQVFNGLQFQHAQREKEQAEARQAAEVEYLEEAEDYREYRRRRADRIIAEPSLPQDEMTMADYKIVRTVDPDQEVLVREDEEGYAVLPEEHRR